MRIIAVIPARYASTRFPAKLMQDLGGKSVIRTTYEAALNTQLFDDVFVVTDESLIFDEITSHGGKAIMSKKNHESGSDRIAEAIENMEVDLVVNVQGDLPTIDPALIRRAVEPLADPEVDIATLAVEIRDEAERGNPNVVKAVVGFAPGRDIARALYFTRVTAPSGVGPHYHHIGLYAYRRDALRRFVSLPPGVLETRERLEQLRALEAGMRIDVALVDTVPLGVDTPADLDRARGLMGSD
jgi:3-deoxy-manno-octulosonate cytidylyltransferase (CMP-KDO synthetase)